MTNAIPQAPDPWHNALDRQYRASLMAFFRRRAASPSDAEDMVQEVFARILATPDIDRERAGAYIFRAATNLLRDRARRQSVRDAWREQLAQHDGQDAIDHEDPERLVGGRLALQAVKAVLDTLPERTRAMFVLYRLHGMAQREIAARFGISTSAVEKHIATAMLVLMQFRAEWQ